MRVSNRSAGARPAAREFASERTPVAWWRRGWFPPLLMATVGILLYRNSLQAPLVFDGHHFILDNPAIRQIWPWIFSLGGDHSVGASRPFGFFTFALNYAWGGTEVFGYHVVNVAIHVTAAWLIFDLVRRTLSRGRLAARYAAQAWGLALAIALLWLVHPLQTNTVTYVYQRLESLMGLCYLATLWCFVRGLDAPRRGWWFAASVVCCALGMATKEVMVTAPLIVLWYDRAFVAASWRALFHERGGYYTALAGTWGVLAALMIATRDDYAGLGVIAGLSPIDYAQSEPGVILHYLRLAFWPDALCLNYGWPVARTAAEIVPPALAIGALVALTAWSAYRWPELGFLGAWFFVILAPTSSVAPLKDLVYEHRMYLSLASVAALSVLAVDWLWRRIAGSLPATAARFHALPAVVLVVVLVALGTCTVLRNRDYESELSIWEDAVRKRPENAFAYYNIAFEQDRHLGNQRAAIAAATIAIEKDPDFVPTYVARADALRQVGEYQRAIRDYDRTIERKFSLASALQNRAVCHRYLQQYDAAVQDLTRAMEIAPDNDELYFNRGLMFQLKGDYGQAIRDYSRAVQLNPNYADAYNNRGACYQRNAQYDKAHADYDRAIWIKPDLASAYANRAMSFFRARQYDLAWADVRMLRKLGGQPDPRLLKSLIEASGHGE